MKTMLFATSSYAGMGPYVISIVNSFNPQDNVRFFLIEKEDRYYSKNIKDSLKSNATIVKDKTTSKIDTLLSLITGFKCHYASQLEEICRTDNISIIHDLSGCSDYKFVRNMSTKYSWLYTVHDLYPHESKKRFYKEIRQKKIYSGIFKSISATTFLITNSNQQYRDLKKIYPFKSIYLTPFPSLLTQTIRQGGIATPELKNIKKYILFFGRIEEYKGIKILLEAFKSIKSDIKLVIAGSGELPHSITDSRVIFINRYIDDREIKYLYKNSLFVVYPYLSATQSGVIAVASYFNTPIIASDVPFFKDCLGKDYFGLFKNRDILDLTAKIDQFINLSSKERTDLEEQMAHLYHTHYEKQTQRLQLLSVYENIKHNNHKKHELYS